MFCPISSRTPSSLGQCCDQAGMEHIGAARGQHQAHEIVPPLRMGRSAATGNYAPDGYLVLRGRSQLDQKFAQFCFERS